MNKRAIIWGVRLGSISLAVGLAAYMSAQENGQQEASGNNVQQNSTSSQQDDTLAPQNGQAESNQQFGGRRGQHGPGRFNEQTTEDEQSANQYSGNTQSGTDEQSGTASQYSDNAQSGESMEQNSRSFDTMTGGS